MSKFWRIFLLTLLTLVLLVFGALHLVLHTELHNKIIARVTSGIMDAEARLGDIRLDLGAWPQVTVEIDSASLTYPHERYARYSRRDDPGAGSLKDTLAVFSFLRAKADIKELREGRIVGDVELDGLGAYLMKYAEGASNLDVFHFPRKEKKESAAMPEISAALSLGPSRLAYIDRVSDLDMRGGADLDADGVISPARNIISADLDVSHFAMRNYKMRVVLGDMCLVAQVDDNPDNPDRPQMRPGADRRGRTERGKLALPEFLSEESFRESDVDIHLDTAFTALLNKWHPTAALELKKGVLITPALPLHNSVENLKLDAGMNTLRIDSMLVRSGSSDISVKGTVNGLARTLFGKGNGMWRADLDFDSQRINVNEITAALNIAQGMKDVTAAADSLSDREYYDAVAIDTLDESRRLSKVPLKLIVVPANVVADVNLNVEHLDVDMFDVEPVSARLTMKERCVTVNDLKASSSMGNVHSLDAYYYTKSKENIGAGFDFEVSDFTSDDLRVLAPGFGKDVTALQTFTANAGCTAAATFKLDTNMRVIYPSMEGTLQFHADSLSVRDLGDLKKYARLLLFRKLTDVPVHDIDISATMSDGKLEVFPFLVGVDRYAFALTGEQCLDGDFSYRGTVIKSPMIIRAGARAFRKNASRVKVRLSLPQFKSLEAVPTFYEEVDSLHGVLSASVRSLSEISVRDFRNSIERAKETKRYAYKEEDLPEDQQKLSTSMKKASDPPNNKVTALKKMIMKWKTSK